MTSYVKSGNEILEEFFNGLHELPEVDKDIADMLLDLYRNRHLTSRRLANALRELREKEDSDEDKDS